MLYDNICYQLKYALRIIEFIELYYIGPYTRCCLILFSYISFEFSKFNPTLLQRKRIVENEGFTDKGTRRPTSRDCDAERRNERLPVQTRRI